MWEAPNRDRTERAHDQGGDALGGPPDSARPKNPWPRLIAFALTVLVCLVLAGVCVVSFAVPPKRQLKIDVSELATGVPKFYPIIPFGADQDGFTYGAWVTAMPQGNAVAVLSLGPASRCNLKWEANAQAGNQTGAFVDRCSPARFDAAGAALEGSPPRDLDQFHTSRNGTSIYVDLTQVTLGACRTAGASPCSTGGKPVVRQVPNDALPANFGRQ